MPAYNVLCCVVPFEHALSAWVGAGIQGMVLQLCNVLSCVVLFEHALGASLLTGPIEKVSVMADAVLVTHA